MARCAPLRRAPAQAITTRSLFLRSISLENNVNGERDGEEGFCELVILERLFPRSPVPSPFPFLCFCLPPHFLLFLVTVLCVRFRWFVTPHVFVMSSTLSSPCLPCLPSPPPLMSFFFLLDYLRQATARAMVSRREPHARCAL
jgi:hypothetical protein